jgi:hypothetical protein
LFVVRDVGDLLVESRQTIAMAAHSRLELVPLRGEIGKRGGQFREQPFGCGQRRFGLGHALIDAATLFDPRSDLVPQLAVLGIEPLQGDIGIRSLLLFAGDIGRELRQPAVEFGDALARALLFAIQHFAGIGEPLQPGRGAGLRLA